MGRGLRSSFRWTVVSGTTRPLQQAVTDGISSERHRRTGPERRWRTPSSTTIKARESHEPKNPGNGRVVRDGPRRPGRLVATASRWGTTGTGTRTGWIAKPPDPDIRHQWRRNLVRRRD